jgi:hypothetical protein
MAQKPTPEETLPSAQLITSNKVSPPRGPSSCGVHAKERNGMGEYIVGVVRIALVFMARFLITTKKLTMSIRKVHIK